MKCNQAALPFVVALLVAVLVSGCSSPDPSAQVGFPNATINQHPARLIMDTGSGSPLIFQPAHVGLNMTSTAHGLDINGQSMDNFGLSDPASLALGNQTITAPLPVMKDFPWYLRWLVNLLMDSDGLISWPEYKDNILVFDSEHHVVRAVSQLPPETAGWLKFKVRRSSILLLEVPLSDGATGTILVDTGQPFGVSLPPAAWKTWDVGHPKAPSAQRLGGFIGSDPQLIKDAWADEIQLGPLTLTDIPVHPAQATEWQGDVFHYMGTLGMYALARMDLIVDGKNNVAYLHPRPPPGPTYPGVGRANEPANLPDGDQKWTVDPSVKLSTSTIWISAAGYEVVAKDYASAQGDLDHAFALDSDNADAFDLRSGLKLIHGDVSGALADSDRAVALNPESLGAYGDRGFVKYVQGDSDAALADVDHALTLDPQSAGGWTNRGDIEQARGGFLTALDDYVWAGDWQPGGGSDLGYAELHGELLRRQLGYPPADLKNMLDGLDKGWVKTIFKFVAGNLSEADFLAAAAQNDDGTPANADLTREQTCEAEYYLGMVRLLQNDLAAARTHFQKSLATATFSTSESTLSKLELALLDISSSTRTPVQVLFSASQKYLAGDYAGAAADFSQALAADSTHAYAYYYRGLCRSDQGDYAGAIADFTQALALEPKNFLACEACGLAHDSAGDHAAAAADYAQAYALGPRNLTVDASDEIAAETKGDYAAALARHSDDIKSDSREDVPVDYSERGRVKQMLGDFPGALADYQKACTLDPRYTPYSHLNAYFVQLRLGQPADDFAKFIPKWANDATQPLAQFAIGSLDDAALLAKARASGDILNADQLCETYYYIGLSHLAKGDQTGARVSFQKSLATDRLANPCYLLARAELARLNAPARN